MKIKRTVSTYTQKQSSNLEECTIRISARWKREESQQYIAFNVGYTITADKWDKELSRVKKRAINKKNISAFEINKEIQRLEEIIDNVFKKYEVSESTPDKIELRDDVNIALGKKTEKKLDQLLVLKAFGLYILDKSNKKSLAEATIKKFNTAKNILKEFDSELKLNDITSEKLDRYVEYLIEDRGMRNSTAKKNMSMFRGFLHYYDDRGMIKTDWKIHQMELKEVKGKNVIFLDIEEFDQLHKFEFPKNKKYLEKTRDIFSFQCMTSLRYSDIAKLTKSEVEKKFINPVSEKTYTYTKIPLSKKAKAILDKYKDYDKEKALPVPSNQKMNEYLKEICYLLGFDQTITLVYFKGKDRITEVKKKYELIATHTGRRTFICTALASGIPPEVVMRITGHSDYKSMQPYIDVTSKAKELAVNIFD